ncbi:MAG: FAD-binding protein, partial [Candidatus Thioglobus sp.]
MDRIAQLQDLVKQKSSLKISSKMLDYAGIVEYYPEELVLTVKAGTKIPTIHAELKKHNQALPFFTNNDCNSIGAAYANGGQDLADSVLGVQIIDGNGELLNFGGQVIKNVAGYDISRLLVGSKGHLAIITQISFKVLPIAYVGELLPPVKSQ